jgi:hypothetical protein
MVDTAKINDWLQVIGMFGVIASLMFVGLQMKQTQDIALSNTYLARTAIAVESNTSATTSPQYLSGMSKLYANRAGELTMQEAIALEHQLGSTMQMIENNHFQYLNGFLSEEHWQRNLDEMRCTFSLPFNREVIIDWPFRDSFDAVLAEVVEQAIEDEENCWASTWKYPLE